MMSASTDWDIPSHFTVWIGWCMWKGGPSLEAETKPVATKPNCCSCCTKARGGHVNVAMDCPECFGHAAEVPEP